MGRVILKYVETFTDRLGRTKTYFRHKGKRTPLPASDDPAFASAYKKCLASIGGLATTNTKGGADTLGWLVREYQASPEFKKLGDRTKKDYLAILSRIAEEHGEKGWRSLNKSRVMKHIRDPWADKPRRADTRVAVLSAVYGWAIARDMTTDNPCKGVPKLYEKGGTDGYRAWTADEVTHFLAQCGDREFTVFLLAVYTGQRPGDLRRLTWFQYDGTTLNVGRQNKTKQAVRIPVHPVLKAHLDTLPRGEGTILQNRYGKAYSEDALTSMFRSALVRMEMPKGAVMYGLRATHADTLAEAGASPHQIAATTGHKTLAMVQHYTRNASQHRLATASVSLLPNFLKDQ
ncbi:tyrosine-type recombinase/integrase [Acuticoccus yangtzensis]|uniref:tyrosine-type recombinase/integrase n=1 Tax=Acuticoccus yangtzensis TaxID=1443441 RepID=UPI0009499C21|nr:site-specific integrase [Acuticoccus yangtzensis]